MADNYHANARQERAEAERIAVVFRKYWLSRGHDVNVWLERVEVPNSGRVTFAIRSNLPKELLRHA